MRRIYFDANVFLAFVSDEPDRAATVEELLRQAKAKSVAVLTSTVSIAEVAYGGEEKLQQVLDVAVEVATYETNRHARWSDLIGLAVSEPALSQAPLDFGRPPDS